MLETLDDEDLLGKSGWLVDNHAMVWVRKVPGSLDDVWTTISTRKGLAKWWIATPIKFELKRGGAFNHHWNNTIQDFQTKSFIDFKENDGRCSGTGGMRFELKPLTDEMTQFLFLDTWGPDSNYEPEEDADDEQHLMTEQPGGIGTPWPGVAAGWHHMVDRLVCEFDGSKPPHDYDVLTRFYIGYLRDSFRLREMVKRKE